jgi:predicted lipoprotein with Yx(FWY)xxD motif
VRPHPTKPGRGRGAALIAIALAAVLCAALLASPAGARPRHAPLPDRAAHSRTVAKRARNASLGEIVLTNLRGRTLYTLSAEVRGKFICTGACLSTWHPLVVPKGVKPLGPTRLGLVKRPDGRMQVTFRGRPLYTFSGDARAGQANGEGFEDVGTWHAASLGKITHREPPSQPEESPSPYPY